jgi:hypothetical protein
MLACCFYTQHYSLTTIKKILKKIRISSFVYKMYKERERKDTFFSGEDKTCMMTWIYLYTNNENTQRLCNNISLSLCSLLCLFTIRIQHSTTIIDIDWLFRSCPHHHHHHQNHQITLIHSVSIWIITLKFHKRFTTPCGHSWQTYHIIDVIDTKNYFTCILLNYIHIYKKRVD